ncbi:MAG: Rrf2 family transcriptional regulator, partial [Roseicyclus sp.]|nr:Rrf2 family transcriptional regulator [Roseicyclus sp.]
MKRNSRLSLALHTLGHMAGHPDRMRTSAEIAAHADTNPVVVKRVLGRLRAAGLLVAEKGHAGGWRLAHAPETITLADVYLALDERLAPEAETADPRCAVEHALEHRMAAVMEDAEK